MWATLPINAAFMVFNTVLPLYVLSIRGNVLDITNLFGIFNLISIPFSILWGGVIDRFHRRGFFFAISFIGCSAVFTAMFFLRAIPILFLLCGLLAVAITASGPVSSLLVMETAERKRWYDSFGRLFFIANLGSALGLLVGLVWPASLPISYVLLFCSASSIASVVFTYLLVTEPPITLEAAALSVGSSNRLTRFYVTIAGRLQLIVTLPLRSFSRDGMTRTYRTLRTGMAQAKSLLFFSTLFYMVAWAILNMSYVAFLSSYGISNNWIFGITFANMLVQLIGYALVSRLAARMGGGWRLGLYSILLTTVPYALIGLSAVSLSGVALLVSNLALFSISGLGFAMWNSSTSLALYSNLGTQGQAGVLGAYSALIGLGTVIGSFVSGIVSFYVGYSVTFLLSGAILLVSLGVLRESFKLMVSTDDLR